MGTVRTIAQRPHPVGSADHDRVRDYIRSEFVRLGLTPTVQTGDSTFLTYRGKAENILARLPGQSNTRPVMLVAHYDSVPAGPGASDDGHGVAVLLEMLRVLRQARPLRNDVIFLVSDGEEEGLLGAALFMREHPWRTEPGVVLNFDSRGTSGAATMFETSHDNAWLLGNLREAVPSADASSFEYEIYKRMPNGTDLSVFKLGGLAGMNFAFIEHVEWYHSPQDTPGHLDLRSLQEQGNYAMALTKRFGGLDLRQTHAGDAVFFPTRLTPLIVYPESWVGPLAWLTLLGLLVAATTGRLRRIAGFWLAVPLGIAAILQLPMAKSAPGATYLLEWPLLGGVIAYAILMTSTPSVGGGWRTVVLALAPAGTFLLVAPMLRMLVVALGPVQGGMIAAIAALWMAVTLMPQITLLLRASSGGQTS
jgi:hypothetical protein